MSPIRLSDRKLGLATQSWNQVENIQIADWTPIVAIKTVVKSVVKTLYRIVEFPMAPE